MGQLLTTTKSKLLQLTIPPKLHSQSLRLGGLPASTSDKSIIVQGRVKEF